MKSREFGKSLQPSIFYTQVGQVDPVLGVVWCDVVLWILDKNGSHLEMAQKNTKNLRHSENQHFSEKIPTGRKKHPVFHIHYRFRQNSS